MSTFALSLLHVFVHSELRYKQGNNRAARTKAQQAMRISTTGKRDPSSIGRSYLPTCLSERHSSRVQVKAQPLGKQDSPLQEHERFNDEKFSHESFSACLNQFARRTSRATMLRLLNGIRVSLKETRFRRVAVLYS